MYECMYMYGSEQGSNHESRAPAQKIPPHFDALNTALTPSA